MATIAPPGLPIELPQAEIARFCDENHIIRMSLFGSVLRDDFTDDSDIDVIVEFEPGKTPGFAFVGLADELGTMLKRPVDLLTPGFLRGPIGKRILASAAQVYVRD